MERIPIIIAPCIFFIERIAIKIKPTAASKVSGLLISPRER